MLLLLHGWLAVSWGHSPLFLAVFAAARLAPKILLTVPAGVISDQLPRRDVLFVARGGYALAALIPLGGLFAPLPVAWLFAGVALAGALHAFDLSSSRAALGDMVDGERMHAAVALNRAGSQVAALVGPTAAFLLMSSAGAGPALMLAALILSGSAAMTLPLPCILHAVEGRRGAAGLYRYLKGSPVALLLLVGGILPTFIDKGVALLLPSLAQGGDRSISMALVAPELGALVMVSALALAPVRLNTRTIAAMGVAYAMLLAVASTRMGAVEILVVLLGLAGMASAAISTSTQANLQRLVPAEMRGRVFAV